MQPAGSRGAPVILPLVAVFGSLIVGLAVAVAEGGIAWLGALLLAGAAAGWLLLERRMVRGATGPDRPPGDASAGRRSRFLPTAAILVITVAAGVIIVGALGGFL
ncbi:hypothetical protein [Candidatus Solirubrobacter pratensis]|uniref:hypothetical protein n=1 Tax=Candidatus Solirubrobacter pratensis TaxID=1298857 RepID=UPI00041FE613|nr:hypothetical protein [Candidatus Solirubrobacter pratensis]